jgi:hypothetical protein
MRTVFAVAFVTAVTLAGQSSSSSRAPQRRGIALLIGNINYPEDPLASVEEDLRGMKPALESLGFETDVRKDLDKPDDFRNAVDGFLRDRKADASDIVLVLYSGHGMQLDGSTYLLGKNYQSVKEPQAAAYGHAFSVDDLVKELERASPYARIVIIDACRINAFSSQGQRGGVALRQNYDNTIVLFSNEPGKTVPARAASSLSSPFIEALIYALTTANHGIKEIFEMARRATIELSPSQIPEMLTSSNYESELLSVRTPRPVSTRAAELVNEAKQFYVDRSWNQYIEVFQTAKAVANDQALKSRVDRELLWVTHVEDAERAAEKNDYSQEAIHWDRAWELFPARSWTLERAALARLKYDDAEDAIPLFGRLSLVSDDVVASRARLVLESLAKSEPHLNDLVTKSRSDVTAPSGAEFELVAIKQ